MESDSGGWPAPLTAKTAGRELCSQASSVEGPAHVLLVLPSVELQDNCEHQHVWKMHCPSSALNFLATISLMGISKKRQRRSPGHLHLGNQFHVALLLCLPFPGVQFSSPRFSRQIRHVAGEHFAQLLLV